MPKHKADPETVELEKLADERHERSMPPEPVEAPVDPIKVRVDAIKKQVADYKETMRIPGNHVVHMGKWLSDVEFLLEHLK